MNTRSIAMIAILAVAAVAIVGAGFAAYWGQTTVEDNAVNVQYLSVETDMASIQKDLEFNTTYHVADSDAPVPYKNKAYFEISPSGSNFTYNTTTEKMMTVLSAATAYDIKAPTDLTGKFDFQVTIENVSIGSNASLWLGLGATNSAVTSYIQFFPVTNNDSGTNTYVAIIPAPALDKVDATDLSKGYHIKANENCYATVYLGEDTMETAATPTKTTLEHVNDAKCNVSGDIVFQGIVTHIAKTETITSGTITYVANGDKDASGTEYVITDLIKDGAFELSIAYKNGANATANTASHSITGVAKTGTANGKVIVAFSANGGDDVFYRAYDVTA
ncbi:MAG: hypothetical protein E7Z65_05520 [Thermoplasmata archaeon]|nr:hypothetical protein [Thermoplasmata archaeon]